MTLTQYANIHKALSNENRLEMFLTILQHGEKTVETCECPVGRLVEKLHIGAPTVSHHLKELVNAGLVETRKEGKFVIASVNKATLLELQNEFKFDKRKKENNK